MQVNLDPETEQILERALEQGRYASPEQALAQAVRLLARQNEDDWLLRNRDAIDASLDESFAAKDRGELVSPEQARAVLDERRATRTRAAA